MKKLLTIILSIALFGITACGSNSSTTSPDISDPISHSESETEPTDTDTITQDADEGEYDKVYEQYAHFLLFEADGNEIGRMLTISTDTYDSLSPYFPTIPEKTGFKSYWERIDDVYLEEQKIIVITAYYSKL